MKKGKHFVRRMCAWLMCCTLLLGSCSTNSTFTIKSDEPEADIYIDDEYVGTGSAVYSSKKGSHQVRLEHEDYRTLNRTIEAERVAPKDTPEGEDLKSGFTLGLVYTFVGILVGVPGAVLYLTGVDEAKNTEPTTYNPNPGEGLKTAGSIMTGAGVLLTGLGIPVVVATGAQKNRWNLEYKLDLSPYSIYDSAGYHRTTGFNKYGVNRQGNFEDGSSFTGRIVRGKKEGYGTYTTAEGEVFVGTFRNDELSGFGYARDENGLWYFGEWNEGMQDGSLVEVFSDGTAQYGQWIMGNKLIVQAYGTEVSSPMGDWIFLSPRSVDGLAHGYGEAMSTDGKVRIENGHFHEGNLVMGTLITDDAYSYQGLFSDGILACGTLTRPDGSEYRGDMKENIPHGYGKLVQADGTVYEGEFIDGQFEGMGLIVKANGESYQGSFENGKPHGKGIYKFGKQVESCEYYEGKRIDALYLARVERQKQEEERRRREEERRRAEEERRRKEAERQRRLAEERREAQEAAERRQRNKALFKGLTAVAGAAVIASSDIVPDDAKADVAAGFVEDVVEEDYTLSRTRAAADEASARRKRSRSGSGSTAPATSSFGGTQGWSGSAGSSGGYTAGGASSGGSSSASSGRTSGSGGSGSFTAAGASGSASVSGSSRSGPSAPTVQRRSFRQQRGTTDAIKGLAQAFGGSSAQKTASASGSGNAAEILSSTSALSPAMKKWGGEESFPDIPGLYVRVACIRQNTHTKAYEYGFKFRNGSDRTIRLINVKLDDGMWNNKNWKIAPGTTGNFSDGFDRLTADAAPNVPVSVHIKAQYE